eukprot:c14944_g1_i1.p1 GENE.c14944_g1_i1~~c14944_g1_i1.p1  ORF type:complete len:786 (+),score=213.39 c14944_g1_i1:59-2416(+)
MFVCVLVALVGAVACIDDTTTPSIPFQIVRPGPNRELEAVSEGLKLLAEMNEPVTIVGIVGPYRSGKSFLMNTLLGDTKGFVVGSSVESTTHGLWLRDTGLRAKDNSRIVFLDTEGFFDKGANDMYDAKIFALTALLSSHVLYNTVNSLDKAAVQYLDVLSRRMQLFNLRNRLVSAEVSGENPVLHQDVFPPLTWIIEGSSQHLEEDCEAYLDEFLSRKYHADKIEGSAYSGIRDVFPSVRCRTMFFPHTDRTKLQHLASVETLDNLTPEFIDGIQKLRDAIFGTTGAKQSSGFLNGRSLSTLVSLLIGAANSVNFPTLPSQWTAWSQQLSSQAEESTTDRFENLLKIESQKRPPLSAEALADFVTQKFDDSLAYYEEMLFRLEHLYSKDRLIKNLERLKEQAVMWHKEAVRASIDQAFQNLDVSCFRDFKVSFPAPELELETELKRIGDECLGSPNASLPAFQTDPEFSKQYQALVDRVQLRQADLRKTNQDTVRKMIDDNFAAVMRLVKEHPEVEKRPNGPFTTKELNRIHDEIFKDADRLIEEYKVKMTQMGVTNKDIVVVRTELRSEWQRLLDENDKVVSGMISEQLTALFVNSTAHVAKIEPFPDTADVIKHKLFEITNITLQRALLIEFASEQPFYKQHADLRSQIESLHESTLQTNLREIKDKMTPVRECFTAWHKRHPPLGLIPAIEFDNARGALNKCFDKEFPSASPVLRDQEVAQVTQSKEFLTALRKAEMVMSLAVVAILLGMIIWLIGTGNSAGRTLPTGPNSTAKSTKPPAS